MRHEMFSIFDQKAKAYLPPFVLPNVAMAVRTFGDCCNSKDHQFGAHPEDYTLFKIGEWSTDGLHQPCAPELICQGLQLIKDAAEVSPKQVSLLEAVK